MYNCVASWQSLGLFHQFSPLLRQTNLNTSLLHGYPPLCRFFHDHVIKWKHFPRYWQFVRGIHRSPVNSPHKGQWCGALMVFHLRPYIRLSKQSQGWCFETLSRPLWRQCNVPRIRQPHFGCQEFAPSAIHRRNWKQSNSACSASWPFLMFLRQQLMPKHYKCALGEMLLGL